MVSLSRKSGSGPPLCSKRHDVETPYYGLLQTCIGGTQSRRWVSIKDRAPWPARSNLKSNEIQIYGNPFFLFFKISFSSLSLLLLIIYGRVTL